MLTVAELLLLALCVAHWAPGTRIGKFVRTILIDRPAEAFSRTTPLKVIVWIAVFAIAVAIAISAPEWVALFGFGDLVAYLDVGVILLLASAVERSRVPFARAVGFARRTGAHLVSRWNRGRRRSRLSRPNRPKAPPGDDEGPAGWGWAFA